MVIVERDPADKNRYRTPSGMRPFEITRETIDLMSIVVADGDISARDAFDLMQAMADADRCLRLSKSAEELRR